MLEGVDSDEEDAVLEDLIRRAEEIHRLEMVGSDEGSLNVDELRRKEALKIRQLMQL